MTEISLTHLLDVAICAAEAAGQHALNNKHRRHMVTETFTHDIKLALDLECQQAAEKLIASEFPDHDILGEEDSHQNHNAVYEWVIDPIDGTLNFSQGFPYWCCSVAVRRDQKVLAGCVYAPEFGDFYTAHIEEPAKLNGHPIRVSEVTQLPNAVILTGLSKTFEQTRKAHFEVFHMLAHNTRKVRIHGAAALDLCHIAAGTSDGFYESGIYLWDFAAAGLIAEQAGAVLTLYPQEDSTYTVLCSNPHLIVGLRAIHTKCLF
jgi:myo-inositol-1(or 4)-monophosphatase